MTKQGEDAERQDTQGILGGRVLRPDDSVGSGIEPRLSETNYAAIRREIYEPLREEGRFTWDIMEGAEYALAGCLAISPAFREEIAAATDALGRVFAKTVAVLQRGGDELLLGLGLPPETLAAACIPAPGGMLTAVGRFDFARTPHGLKMLEFNSDTPTGVVEAAYVNGVVCRQYGMRNPNEAMDADIRIAFTELYHTYDREGWVAEESAGDPGPAGMIAFSALDWHDEDAGTTRYLLEQSGLDGRFAALSDLRLDGDRLYALLDGELKPIRLLYRLHPLEKMAEDRDEDGYPTGPHLLDLIARERLKIINPPAAFAAQSKAVQAVIWGLHEDGLFYSEEEHRWIERYMLPTYLENRFEGRSRYVVKPVFGREGGGVSLHEPDGEVWLEDGEQRYRDQTLVYQQFAELEPIETETEQGLFRGHLLWGSFWIGSRPSGIIARVGGRITGNLAYFLPVGYVEER